MKSKCLIFALIFNFMLGNSVFAEQPSKLSLTKTSKTVVTNKPNSSTVKTTRLGKAQGTIGSAVIHFKH